LGVLTERNKNAHHWAVFVLNLRQTGPNPSVLFSGALFYFIWNIELVNRLLGGFLVG
jgi:hypothetical protein